MARAKRSAAEEALRDEAAGVLCGQYRQVSGFGTGWALSDWHLEQGLSFAAFYVENEELGLFRDFLLSFQRHAKRAKDPARAREVMETEAWRAVLRHGTGLPYVDTPANRMRVKRSVLTAQAPDHVLRRLIATFEPDPLLRAVQLSTCAEEEATLNYDHIRFSDTQYLDFIADEG